MPLSRPLAPFRSQPTGKRAPRKTQIVVAQDDQVPPSIKARRKAIKIAAAAAKPQLRVLRAGRQIA